jgi:hypothetical protein
VPRLAIAAGAALVVALAAAASAFALGAPSPWENAQVGLTYTLYRPTATLGLSRAEFRLVPCQPGQDESVFATYGRAYNPPSNFGKVRGFSIGEGYPSICANAGIAKYVTTRTVNGARIRVSVYCDPAQFKSCTIASGFRNGYVLQWRQPYRATQVIKKRTVMFMDSSLLTLPQVLQVVGGLRPVL